MAKKPTKTRSTRIQVNKSQLSEGLVSLAPVTYPVADTEIAALQVWHNPDRKPPGDGPWNDEADKVAWVDEETQHGCIMLRQKNGTLSGYVGVGTDHSLFGFNADAVPIDIAGPVHGGLTYGKACEVNRFKQQEYGNPRTERYTVCHATVTGVVRNYRTVKATKDKFEHEELWWLGFDTDHVGDLVPKGYDRHATKGDVYRDQAFVYGQVVAFARRLKEIAGAKNFPTEGDTGLIQLPAPSADRGHN